MSKLQLAILGATGRTGGEIYRLAAEQPDMEIAFASGREVVRANKRFVSHLGTQLNTSILADVLQHVDLLIDFSTPTAHLQLLQAAQMICAERKKLPAILVGTTGWDEAVCEQWNLLCEQSPAKVLFAANTSLGILLMNHLLRSFAPQARQLGFELGILDIHHSAKKDAPSGTALVLAASSELSPQEGAVAALRLGSQPGFHSLYCVGEHEQLVIQHQAFTRKVFADGALRMSRWLIKQVPSRHCYSLSNIDLCSL